MGNRQYIWNSEKEEFELVDVYDGFIAECKRLGFNIRRPTKYAPDRIAAWASWVLWGVVTVLSILWLIFGGR